MTLVLLGLAGLLPNLAPKDRGPQATDESVSISPPVLRGECTQNAHPQDKEKAGAKQRDPDSAETCAMCHKAIHGEWQGRLHHKAWDDEIYQASIKKKKRAKMCYSCHIPDRVLKKLGRKPKTRKKLLHEGVTCVACHEKDGAMHGPFGAKTDAHTSVKDPLFLEKNSSSLCMSCHSTKIDVVLPVGKDFKKAGLAAKGESCVGCHMPAVERHMAVSPVTGKPTGEVRKGRRHGVLGPNDAAFCATAFELATAKQEGQLTLMVRNKAGHGVPGLRTREFHFVASHLDAAGKVIGEQKVKVAKDNLLLVAENRAFPLKAVAGAAKLRVAIEHHFMGKKVATIATSELKLPQ